MRIGIVGTGVSGMVAAYLLQRDHDLTIFEANEYVGGHTATVDVPVAAGTPTNQPQTTSKAGSTSNMAVDTGFIVYNERTYPNFMKLLAQLGVDTQPSEMSFSVHDDADGMEYAGRNLLELFGGLSNALRPSHYRMLLDIPRFYKNARALLDESKEDDGLTLGEYLRQGGYSRAFVDKHIVPMVSAIWSGEAEQVMRFPCRFFIRFFHNHGMMDLKDRPQWRVIKGGSREYMKKLTAGFTDRIHTHCPISRVTRDEDSVSVVTGHGDTERFDRLIIATHSDQALKMLQDATPAETQVLGAIPYQANDVTLHTDAAQMPRRRRLWSAWNYHLAKNNENRATVTYNMNILQSLPGASQYMVSLNRDAQLAPQEVVRRFVYHHPVYEPASIEAQRRHDEINGPRHTYYCGAYWGFGFHEDGVKSALAVCKHFGVDLDTCAAGY